LRLLLELDEFLEHLLSHVVQIVRFLGQPDGVNLRTVEKHTDDLARVLCVLLRHGRVDEITNLLSHLWRNLDRLRLWLLNWDLLAAERGEVCLHHDWLHLLRVLASGSLTIRSTLSLATLVFATSALVSATTLLLLTQLVFHAVRSRGIQELLHLTPLALVTFLSQLLGRLPKFDVQKAGSENV